MDESTGDFDRLDEWKDKFDELVEFIKLDELKKKSLMR